MNVGHIIESLDKCGVIVELGINLKSGQKPPPEAEPLIKMLSDRREGVIDHLLAGRFVPLPDSAKIPDAFRSERMNEIRAILAVCYRLLELHEGAETEAQWKAAHSYHEGRLDGNDQFAVQMHTAAILELQRQYQSRKKH